MKLLTFILAIIVIVLSGKPGIDAISFSTIAQQNCCSSSKCGPTADIQNSENNNEQDYKTCNPFQACCVGFVAGFVVPIYSILQANISNEQFFGKQLFVDSQFIADCWQPPQFV
jgi:hypothetical protein